MSAKTFRIDFPGDPEFDSRLAGLFDSHKAYQKALKLAIAKSMETDAEMVYVVVSKDAKAPVSFGCHKSHIVEC